MTTQEQVIQELRKVFDPEIPVNIYDMGLIYHIEIDGDAVHVQMTLTSQGCPAAQMLPDRVSAQLQGMDGVGSVHVELVWEPVWSPARMTPAVRAKLGIPNPPPSGSE